MIYRPKSATVEAIRWDGDPHTANTFFGESFGVDWHYRARGDEALVIPLAVEVGEYVVKTGDAYVVIGATAFEELFAHG